MKAIVTLVQVAEDIDIANHAAAVDRALQVIAEAQRHLEGAEARAQTARDALARARLDLGRVLAAARPCWPARGPNAKGWTAFLAARGITLEAAEEAIRYAGHVADKFGGDVPDKLPTRREAGLDHRPLAAERDDDHGQYGPKVDPRPDPDRATAAPFHQLTAAEIVQALARLPPEERKRVLGKANVHGASGERKRGAYCTPKKYADAVGPWDLDPFTNPRSHIVAAERCMLEDGGDGFGDRSQPGAYRVGASGEIKIATADTRVWIQPDYRFVLEAIEHYGHTRFCALLRFAPDTEWFALLWPLVRVVAIPVGERIAFEGEGESEEDAEGAPFPHAFFFADERDLTDELRSMCLVWRVEHQPTNPTEIA